MRAHLLRAVLLLAAMASSTCAAEVFVRCKVVEPAGEKFRVTVSGHIHLDPWSLPSQTLAVAGGQWSPWADLTKWPLHKRLDREGGVAEWPTLKLTVAREGAGEKIAGCRLEVELADRPDPERVAIRFNESSGSATVAFLVPHPLHEKRTEFETGSQMTARHLAWAKEATGGKPRGLKQFELITSVWGHYDPVLAAQATETLQLLGFNVMGGVPTEVLRRYGMKTYAATWHLVADPEASAEAWQKGDGAQIAKRLATEEGRWTYENMAHYVIADEIQTMDFRRVDRAKLNGWFRDFLRARGETDVSLGRPIAEVEYPAEAMYAKSLPRDADLPTRKIHYYAAKFGQWWSVRQLRQTHDLLKRSFAGLPRGMKSETLPSDHSFFNAWGPPHTAMGYRGLDFFEIGAQEAVDVLSVEDWLGLNRMYGPSSTWTGAQALGYLAAIMRSGIEGRNVSLRALITPSDDGYLRLKAYSALGQGAKSIFFWTFGPTYIGTENYWSDLRSQYDGVAKVSAALQKAEPVLYPARTVRDPVAILYSVSHDYWHTDDPASFVENRLTWCALRHASVQPDFLREEDVEAGKLAGYKALFLNGQCLTRKASAKIDEWVKQGGRLYLSAAAATRDEFYEPYLPPFAAAVWPADAARKAEKQSGHAYNERVDLPGIKPLATVRLVDEPTLTPMRAVGCRLDLREGLPAESVFARFDNGRPAAAIVPYGKGSVTAVGFLPGLAYSPFRPNQTTLDEVWPEGPRKVILHGVAGQLDGLRAVAASQPVVEANLLRGAKGSALVLVNHTYRPIERLTLRLRAVPPLREAVSTEGERVAVERDGNAVRLTLPLKWTDIVLLPAP